MSKKFTFSLIHLIVMIEHQFVKALDFKQLNWW
jgi:hypothetical protein